jgi:hypothetical protein
MIQRIQTVYLLLVAILSFVSLISSVGYFTLADEVIATFSNFTFSSELTFKSTGPYALGVLLILVILLSLMSIMLFRKRMRQLRLTIISSILLVGYVVVYVLFAYFYKENIDLILEPEQSVFHLRFVSVFPVLSLILNILAINGIRKDEALVRSLDRLR